MKFIQIVNKLHHYNIIYSINLLQKVSMNLNGNDTYCEMTFKDKCYSIEMDRDKYNNLLTFIDDDSTRFWVEEMVFEDVFEK